MCTFGKIPWKQQESLMDFVNWHSSWEQRSAFFNIFIHFPVNKADDKYKSSLSIYSFCFATTVPFVVPMQKGTNSLTFFVWILCSCHVLRAFVYIAAVSQTSISKLRQLANCFPSIIYPFTYFPGFIVSTSIVIVTYLIIFYSLIWGYFNV